MRMQAIPTGSRIWSPLPIKDLKSSVLRLGLAIAPADDPRIWTENRGSRIYSPPLYHLAMSPSWNAGDPRVGTRGSRICSPLPYHLAISPRWGCKRYPDWNRGEFEVLCLTTWLYRLQRHPNSNRGWRIIVRSRISSPITHFEFDQRFSVRSKISSPISDFQSDQRFLVPSRIFSPIKDFQSDQRFRVRSKISSLIKHFESDHRFLIPCLTAWLCRRVNMERHRKIESFFSHSILL